MSTIDDYVETMANVITTCPHKRYKPTNINISKIHQHAHLLAATRFRAEVMTETTYGCRPIITVQKIKCLLDIHPAYTT